jgi:hypothetical protein
MFFKTGLSNTGLGVSAGAATGVFNSSFLGTIASGVFFLAGESD